MHDFCKIMHQSIHIMTPIIKQVSTNAEWKTFIQFANKLNHDCEGYCPTLDSDEKATFSDKNPVMKFAEYACFLAYCDGKCVGRIAAIINHKANEWWNVKKIRFGWFDFIDDMEVSHALLDTVAQWGKERGMNILNGPVGFTDFDHQGLLLDGFEYPTVMSTLYNQPYYQKHYEAYGFVKDADWIEMRLFVPETLGERWIRLSKLVAERSKVHSVKVHSVKELMARYPNYEFFDVLSDAYSKLYNYQPLTFEQKEYYSKLYFPLLNFDFISIIENEKDELVGVSVGMPDVTQALRKANGSLFPFGWYHLLKALKAKQIDTFNFLLIAVRPDYQDKGVNSLIFAEQFPYFKKYGVRMVETSTILEHNLKCQANFLGFEHQIHKHHRAFAKNI